MRVLLICGAGIVSGKEIMSLHLLNELKERGHQCFCIMSSWGSPDFRERLKAMNVESFDLRIGFISKTLNWSSIRMTLIQGLHMPGLLLNFIRLRNRIKPDVIIHTNFHHIFLLYPVIPKKKNIYWSHEIIVNSPFYKKLFGFFDNRVDYFVAVSEAVANSLRDILGKQKIRTIKNGINSPKAFSTTRNRQEPFVLGIIGQVAATKGHDVLFKALGDLDPARFRLKIVGTGDIDYILALKAMADKLGFGNSCLWSGYVKDTNEIYSDIDIAIVPSIIPDSYPTIVMEAGLRGIPVAASSIGGLAEMIHDGVNGFLAEPGNSEALRYAIDSIMNVPDFDKLKKQTLEFASKTFQLERFGAEFEKLLIETNDQAK